MVCTPLEGTTQMPSSERRRNRPIRPLRRAKDICRCDTKAEKAFSGLVVHTLRTRFFDSRLQSSIAAAMKARRRRGLDLEPAAPLRH